jgi:hypothetical protein
MHEPLACCCMSLWPADARASGLQMHLTTQTQCDSRQWQKITKTPFTLRYSQISADDYVAFPNKPKSRRKAVGFETQR